MIGMLAATRALLTSLDPLPHRERMSRLADWARSAPDRAGICADLRSGNDDERYLALVASMITGDAAGLAAAAHDPAPHIRTVALRAALRDGTLPGHAADLAALDRRRIYRTLRRHRDPAVADALLGEIRAAHGDREAAAVLPGCGPATVRALLPELGHAVTLTALIRPHQEILLGYATELLAAADPVDLAGEWARLAGAVLRSAPEHALGLLERFGPERSLPGDLALYGVLAAHDPRRVVRLLTAPTRAEWVRQTSFPPGLLRRLATLLPAEELIPFARRARETDRTLVVLLAALPPSRRLLVYDGAFAGVETGDSVPSAAIMEVLPRTARVREATRVLGLDTIRRTEAAVAEWSAYLDWPEASAAQEAGLRSGDADERAGAYRRLVAAARRSRDPEAVAAVVARLARLRNEQDPVRSAALGALAGVARLLTADAAAGLTALTTDAVEARDASAGTTAALSHLATGTLRHHVEVPELREWALLTIDLLSTRATVPTLHRFDAVLPRGRETMVFDRLRGWVEANLARGRYAPLLALTVALGKRAWRLPGLQALLGAAAGPATLPWVATEAIGLWLADPRTRAERVEAVLDADPSSIALRVVWETVASRRTDLLDRVLTPGPPASPGRFVEGGRRWVPDRVAHPGRWLPRQQSALVGMLEPIADDAGNDMWRRVAAIRTAAPLGPAGRGMVLRFLDATEVQIAEAALAALVWTVRPGEALPVLLAHAGGDRARVALYSASRAARHLPPSALVEPFGAVLAGPAKVTSRKEAARVLAVHGPPSAMELLFGTYAAADQHRDVRAAITGAARQRLDTGAAWRILDRAASGSREERRAVLAAPPHAVPVPYRDRYARLVVGACRAGDREVRRLAYAVLPAWSRWAGDVTGLIVDRLTDLGEDLHGMTGTQLLLAAGPDALGQALTRLVDRDAADQPPVSDHPAADQPPVSDHPAADHPARRRIVALGRAVTLLNRTLPASADRTAQLAALGVLAEHPEYLGTAASALVVLGRLENLDRVADLCADRPVAAVRAGATLGELREMPEDPVLHELIARLADRGDLAGGLFAVALVRRGAAAGWAGRWRELLVGLRAHADPDVREEALAVDMRPRR
ncbi:hypothetical protein [Actinoplanes sp. NPDC051851]|uniref:hypothetical protein n=1 Tax=Actinoplanes sp. NPDC051851 TaxID=3154753 RepID=UPI00343F25C4